MYSRTTTQHTYVYTYVYATQAAADDYSYIIPYISLVALVKTMVCSGKNPMTLKK